MTCFQLFFQGKCAEYLSDNLTGETAVETLKLADIFSIPDLKKCALQTILNHCDTVLGEEGLKAKLGLDLCFEVMSLLMKRRSQDS